MRTVHLYGSMAEQFGKTFQLEVASLAEAVRALGTQLPGFRKAIEEGRFRVSCGQNRRRGLGLNEDLIDFRLPAGDIHVTPVVAGRKSGGGIGKIIVGTLLAVAGFGFGIPFLGAIGVSMALGGVSSLLSQKKKAKKEQKSYMFNDGANVTQQGGPVPLAFGRCMVSTITISAGVQVSDSNGYV